MPFFPCAREKEREKEKEGGRGASHEGNGENKQGWMDGERPGGGTSAREMFFSHLPSFSAW